MFSATYLGFLLVTSSEPVSKFSAKSAKVVLAVSKETGRVDLTWGKSVAISQSHGEVKLSSGKIERTDTRPTHQIDSTSVKDGLGAGIRVIVRHLQKGSSELRQTFWLYDGRPEVVVRLDLIDPSGKGSNQLVPLTTSAPVRVGSSGSLQSLFVPYDNDKYSRYSSRGWGKQGGEDDGSYEVGALYDDKSRNGLVVGSLDHDVWKSAIRFDKGGGLKIIAGATGKHTHDTQPHGTVMGSEVRSPRFNLGFYGDWREGLERFGDLNAIVKPSLPWKGKVPFGWNSWSAHKSKLNADHAKAALEFVRDDIPWLKTDGTAYINLDSYWDNLSADQLTTFVKKAHESGLKAGIYWAPFVNWGEPDWKAIGNYLFRDIQLKGADGQLLPKHNGAWPLDPTHPGTLQRIDEKLKQFADQGFDYIKLDFLTHGAMEGKHFDSSITTGTAAYNYGMKYFTKNLFARTAGRPFFVSLSIAPLFPHGYGHSRRISCDVFADIGASEYLLNSQNYGWWSGGRIYKFNDPDSSCVYQAEGERPTTEAEGRTRLTASVVSGGMILQGDNLTNPDARKRVAAIFSNKSVLELASKVPNFRPVMGDIGGVGGDLFLYRKSPDTVYVAAFNFDKKRVRALNESALRLGLTGTWSVEELWTGTKTTVGTQLKWNVGPTDCALLKLNRM